MQIAQRKLALVVCAISLCLLAVNVEVNAFDDLDAGEPDDGGIFNDNGPMPEVAPPVGGRIVLEEHLHHPKQHGIIVARAAPKTEPLGHHHAAGKDEEDMEKREARRTEALSSVKNWLQDMTKSNDGDNDMKAAHDAVAPLLRRIRRAQKSAEHEIARRNEQFLSELMNYVTSEVFDRLKADFNHDLGSEEADQAVSHAKTFAGKMIKHLSSKFLSSESAADEGSGTDWMWVWTGEHSESGHESSHHESGHESSHHESGHESSHHESGHESSAHESSESSLVSSLNSLLSESGSHHESSHHESSHHESSKHESSHHESSHHESSHHESSKHGSKHESSHHESSKHGSKHESSHHESSHHESSKHGSKHESSHHESSKHGSKHESSHHESSHHESSHHESSHHGSSHHESSHHGSSHHESSHHESSHPGSSHHESSHHESSHHESSHPESSHHESAGSSAEASASAAEASAAEGSASAATEGSAGAAAEGSASAAAEGSAGEGSSASAGSGSELGAPENSEEASEQAEGAAQVAPRLSQRRVDGAEPHVTPLQALLHAIQNARVRGFRFRQMNGYGN